MKIGYFYRSMLLVSVLLSGCGAVSNDSRESQLFLNSRTGELEGYEAINTLIQKRLLDPAVPGNAAFAIEAVGGAGILDVSEMLGSYGTVGERNEFLHGEPNPFNVMLWQNQLGILAQTIGQACLESGTMEDAVIFPVPFAGPLRFTFHPQVLANLQALCLLPLEKSLDSANLERLWLQLMSYDAPQDEELAWQDFFQVKDPIWTSRAERIGALFFTMVMNPYFILQE